MKESEFYEWLETQPVENKIVSIKYKYSHEKEWIQSNEILEVTPSFKEVYVWLNDWNEGQQDIEILGCISVSDINVPIFDRKTEPNCSEIPNNCETCRFELYCPEMCEGCCEWDSHYEPKDEPQICSVNGRPYDCGNCEYHKCMADEPQTERSK